MIGCPEVEDEYGEGGVQKRTDDRKYTYYDCRNSITRFLRSSDEFIETIPIDGWNLMWRD